MNEIKIGIVEDRSMFRIGLSNLIDSNEGMKVTVIAENGKDAIIKLRNGVPDVLFMDYQMPEMNGMEATKILMSKYPELKILILSNYDAEELVISSIAAGAVGYITKEEDTDEIFRAIESISSTGYYLNDKTSKHLIGSLVRDGKIVPSFKSQKHQLNDMEIKVMRLMAKEYSTKEIADIMFRGIRTIEGYRSSIMSKTGAKNSCGIIMYGVKNGIIDLE